MTKAVNRLDRAVLEEYLRHGYLGKRTFTKLSHYQKLSLRKLIRIRFVPLGLPSRTFYSLASQYRKAGETFGVQHPYGVKMYEALLRLAFNEPNFVLKTKAARRRGKGKNKRHQKVKPRATTPQQSLPTIPIPVPGKVLDGLVAVRCDQLGPAMAFLVCAKQDLPELEKFLTTAKAVYATIEATAQCK